MVKHEKLTMDEQGNAVYQVIDNGKIIQTLTPQEKDKNLFREKEFCYIFQRTALDTLRMVNVHGFFIQKIVYRVPNKDGFSYHHFYWEKGMLPHVKILDSRLGRLAGFCFSVNVNDRDYVRKTAHPKRLSVEKAKQIIKEGEYEGIPYLGIFGEDDGAEFVAPKSD